MKNKQASLGQYLRDKRVAAGLTQAEIAEFLGYTSPQYISNIERGVCPASFDVLAKLRTKLKLDVERVLQIHIAQLKVRLMKELARR